MIFRVLVGLAKHFFFKFTMFTSDIYIIFLSVFIFIPLTFFDFSLQTFCSSSCLNFSSSIFSIPWLLSIFFLNFSQICNFNFRHPYHIVFLSIVFFVLISVSFPSRFISFPLRPDIRIVWLTLIKSTDLIAAASPKKENFVVWKLTSFAEGLPR